MIARPEATIVEAVAILHERGMQGVRIQANFYATGHWRCRVLIPEAGDRTRPRDERNILMSYSNGMEWDLFGDGRTAWSAVALADRLAGEASIYPRAVRADPGYVAWLAELRRRTGGGWFVMWEDAYTREAMWDERGLVSLVYADADAREKDQTDPRFTGVDDNGWTLAGTMPLPPIPD